MLPRLAAAILILMAAAPALAIEPAAKKSFTLAKDGFPTGTDTPEGAACDLARAFIRNDPALFLATCVEPFGGQEAKLAYHKFLEGIVVQMKMDPAGTIPSSPESPKSIARCFAARHLLQTGPVSYGDAAFGFQDVMFVDVSALLQNGGTQLCRTLVIRNRAGRWLVDPQPEQSPLLSAGLDDESPSSQDFSEAGSAK